MQNNASPTPSLDAIDELEHGVWRATVLKTALELDVFSVVAQGRRTLSSIMSATGCSERGLSRLLDALCPMGLLGKDGDQYALTPVSEAYLVRGKPAYYGDFSLRTQLAWQTRARAAEAVRTGTAVGGDFSRPETEGLWAAGKASAIVNWPETAKRAGEMWETLGVRAAADPALRILDVACGAGVKSFALAQSAPRVQVTALDLPKVLEVAAQVASAMGVARQVTFVSDDILRADLGHEQFDIVLFGAILYYFPLSQRADVLRRAFRALKQGALLVINEAVADEARCLNEPALMAAFQLLLFAPQSEVYTFTQYNGLLADIGFGQIKQHNDQLISALKPAP